MPFETVARPIRRRLFRLGKALVLFYILFEKGARPILGWPCCLRRVLVLL